MTRWPALRALIAATWVSPATARTATAASITTAVVVPWGVMVVLGETEPAATPDPDIASFDGRFGERYAPFGRAFPKTRAATVPPATAAPRNMKGLARKYSRQSVAASKRRSNSSRFEASRSRVRSVRHRQTLRRGVVGVPQPGLGGRVGEDVGLLGDAVSEAVASAGLTVRRLAVRELPRSGQPDELLDRYGISARHIVDAVKKSA